MNLGYPEIISDNNCRIRFSAAERVSDNLYRTVGSSRTVGIYSDGDTPWQARDNIRKAISEGFEQPLLLEYREQIAEKTYIDSLVSQV
jgi:hypothetical protein